MPDLSKRLRSYVARWVYRADRFLGFPPIFQVVFVVLVVTGLVCVFATLGYVVFSGSDVTAGESLWWSVAMILDGGTMAADNHFARPFALTVTVTGVFVVSFLTGAFASSMSARIAELRSGWSPAVERGHLIVLGFDSHVPFLARELAHSSARLTVVLMSLEDKDTVERAIRPARFVPGTQVRFVVRNGDPRSEPALHRISADRARAIIVVPPARGDDEASVHWGMSTLLALRRVLKPRSKTRIVVEARQCAAEPILRLAGEADVAGPGALDFEIVATDDVIARVLAQSARQEGIYFALREILSVEGCEVRVVRLPRELVGRSVADAYASMDGAVVLGVLRASGASALVPESDDAALEVGDRLYVLSNRKRRFAVGATLPASQGGAPSVKAKSAPERVLIVGENRTLARVIEELDLIVTKGSEIVVLGGSSELRIEALFEVLRPKLLHATLRCDARKPSDLIHSVDESLLEMDAIVILGCEDDTDERGDTSALTTLLWLRHGMRRTDKRARRIVTEVRDVLSASSVTSHPNDFLVSTDVVAMLLARAALQPETGRIHKELLSAEGYELTLRPRELYLESREGTFGEAMQAARLRHEIAVGFYVRPEPSSRSNGVTLNPRRATPVPVAPEAQLIVLARPAATARA